ncbi:MAG: hypothetical protein ABI797_08265 [Chloroflexota bacterium]
MATQFGWEGRRARSRARRKAGFRLLKPENHDEDDSDEFAASVERDLAQLPTTNDRDRT